MQLNVHHVFARGARFFLRIRMKQWIVAMLLLFPVALSAQHNRQSLTQPDYDDYNLRFWPRQITVVQKYDSGEDINFQETYCFDSVGRLTEYRKRGFGGERVTHYPLAMSESAGWWVRESDYYHFDYDGDLMELHQYDLKGRLYSSTHYIYAEGGNLVMTVEYTYDLDSGVVAKRTVSNYDKKERLVAVAQYTADELLLVSEKRKYDRRGNLVKRVRTFYDDKEPIVNTEKRVYTYDRHGNWIQCRYILNGKQEYMMERTIIYYGE